ncbi:MAG: hypothetical protein JRF48_11475, partial [Deltaproteobacteria bacterium]|nr:hypothetical protein [Deltaproteobacteria bacterium]
GAPRYPDGKRRCAFDRGDAPWAVCHSERRYAEPFDAGHIPRRLVSKKKALPVAGHLRDLLFERHLLDELVDTILKIAASGAAGAAASEEEAG